MKVKANIPNDHWQWRWIYTEHGGLLHRLAEPFSIPEPDTDEWFLGVDATTLCGRKAKAVMPGVMSRMGRQRCHRCCVLAEVPQGHGNPYNQGLRE
jgi:hypothetical protein